MMGVMDFTKLPPDLPVPEDDGAADHLPGLALPEVDLPSALPYNFGAARLVAPPDRQSLLPRLPTRPQRSCGAHLAADAAGPAGPEALSRALLEVLRAGRELRGVSTVAR